MEEMSWLCNFIFGVATGLFISILVQVFTDNFRNG